MEQENKYKLIAVCGGIASGKSAVMRIIEDLGAQVLSCDKINAELLQDVEYMQELAKILPLAVSDNKVDKKYLRSAIINDESKRELLNALAHPRIFDEVLSRAQAMGGRVFVEVPLLAHSGYRQMFDEIWMVRSARDNRLARLMARDNINIDDAQAMLSKQSEEDTIIEYADCIIDNNDTYNQLCKKIKELYNIELLSLSQ